MKMKSPKFKENLKNNKQLAALIDNPNDFIVKITSDGRIQFINRTPAVISIKETIGQKILDSASRKQNKKIKKAIQHVLKTGKTTSYEDINADNSVVLYKLMISPVKYGGKTVALEFIAKNINEEKEIEVKLKETEEKYKTLVENAQDIIFMIDKNLKILSMNSKAASLFGKIPAEVVGVSIYKIFPRESAVRFAKNNKEVFRTGKNKFIEEKMVIKNKVFYNSTSLSPVKDSNGNITAVIGIVRDITEKKKAEDMLKESEARYRSYIEVTGQIGWTTNSKGAVTEDIPSWRTFTGQSYEEANGYGWVNAIHPDDVKHTRQAWENAVKTKRTYEVEYRVRRHDGVYRWFLARGIPVLNKDKNIQEWVGICIDVTEKKKAEDALKESEQKFRNFFESSNDALFIADIRTKKLVDCNKKAEKLMEYPKTKILSMSADNLHPKDKVKETMEGFKKQMEGKMDILETEVLTKSGKRIPVSINASSMELNGKNYGIAVFRDITEKKKAEDTLKESEEKFKNFFENSNDAIFVADARTRRLVDCNRKAEVLTGYSKTKILAMKADELHPDDKIKETMEGFKKQLEGKMDALESEVLTKSRKRIPVSINASSIEFNGKNYMLGIFRDITEKKRAEDALKESEEKFRKFFENNNDAIFIADTITRKLVDCNKKAESLMEFPKTKILSMDISFLHPKDKIKESMEGFKKQLEGKMVTLETEVLTKSGKRIPVAINGASIEFNGRNYLIGIFRNITEEKRAQEIIKKEIERMKEIDEAKTNFLNIVSHEMKTPLTAINAHLGVMDDLKANLGEQELLSLEAIKRNNYLLKSLIDNILELSRIESGKFELNMSKINLERIIKEVKSNLEILSEKKGLQLVIDVGKLPEVLADEMRVREILNNLISNSIKFTDKGWIKVKAEKQGNHVVISIIDTGIGISKDKINHLFQKFYQIDPSIGRRFGGTGLGLAITKQLIELQGGKITVASTFGKGSTFSVTLPINNHILKGGAK